MKNLDIEVADKTHSDTGASSMDRWANCPGSVRLSKGLPNTSTAYAEEGTKAHELGEKILRGEITFESLKNSDDTSEEMLDAVYVYTSFVQDLWKSIPRHDLNRFMVELKFAHPDIHKGFRGTADSVIYDANTKTLYVTDYKHGAGIPVSAINNKQLLYYAIGSMLALKMPFLKIVMTIVQPRYSVEEAIKSWEIDAVDILDFKALLLDAIEATEAENAAIITGDHCQFCRAKHKCPALKLEAEKAFTDELALEKMMGISTAKLGELLDSIPLIEAWCSGVKEFAYQQATKGILPENYKLVPKRATRKWTDLAKAEQILRNNINQAVMRELMTEPELKTPAQVEKIIGGKAGKELVEKLVIAVSSGNTLVHVSDKRQGVNKQDVADAMFKNQ